MNVESVHYLTRFLYKAQADDKWGEHEIDYILFIRQNVPLDINHNEVADVQYVSPEKLNDLLGK